MGRRMLAADVGWRGGDPRGGGGAPQSSQVHALPRDLRAGARASHSHQARGAYMLYRATYAQVCARHEPFTPGERSRQACKHQPFS
eukprot:2846199-Prymnesium_polylepis.1